MYQIAAHCVDSQRGCVAMVTRLGEFDLRRWFTFDAGAGAASAKLSDRGIGAALQLGFIAMTGTTLRSLEYVPNGSSCS
jgi:hypothetical protein